MGTYTTNYNLFMPSIGEQGWGTLVNGNFTTIDTTMKGLDTRLTTVENEVNGNLNCTSVTTSGKITSTGLITGNGGFKGNLTGNVTGNTTGLLFVKGNVQTSGDVVYATCAAQSITPGDTTYSNTSPLSMTINNYNISYGNPVKHTIGVYTRRSDLTGTTNPSIGNRTVTFNIRCGSYDYLSGMILFYRKSGATSYSQLALGEVSKAGAKYTLSMGAGTYQLYVADSSNRYSQYILFMSISIPAGTTYYVKYATP